MTENPFDLDEGVEANEETSEAADENSSFAEVRKAYKRAQKQIKAYESEVGPLREFKQQAEQQVKEATVKSYFEQVGLSPKQIPLFLREHPEGEATPETVQAFAAEYDLVTATGTPVDAPDTSSSDGFAPVTTGTPSAVSMLTNEDVKRMLLAGEVDAVRKAHEAGRVEQAEVPWPTGQSRF